MQVVLGQIVTSALAAAISPVPLIGLALIFFSKRPGSNSIAYTFGWIVALGIAAAVALGANNGVSEADDARRSGWVGIVVGALFLFLAYRQWQQRPREGYEPPLPKWMDRLIDMKPLPVFGLGLLLLLVNPKNLSLAAAAMTTVANADLSGSQQTVAALIWVLIGSITAIVPTVMFMIDSDRMRPGLQRAKDWLIAHNAIIMMTLFLILGVSSLGQGFSVLGA